MRYVLVHQALYQPGDFADLMGAIAERPELIPTRPLSRLAGGDTQIIELRK